MKRSMQLAALAAFPLLALLPWGAQATPAARAPASAARAPAPLPRDAHVVAIGVYEGYSPVVRPGHMALPVTVNIAKASTPLILSLSSHEPVQWNIRNNGRPIAAVLLSGQHPSTVEGAPGAAVIVTGTANAHQKNTAGYFKLRDSIAEHTPNPIRTFHGAYSGKEFTVAAN